jgi:hypothetical protein
LFLDDIINSKLLKTGDLIVFKAFNNFNSIYTSSYFGHIGIVYVENGIPMLFEANGIEHTPLKSHHSTHGIFLTPLADRIKKYKGRCFWKPLKFALTSDIQLQFYDFIQYALNNMYYEYNVISDGIKKGLGLEKCTNKTNCGQIVFLALLKMQLLDIAEYNTMTFNHLKKMTNIKKLKNNEYLNLIEFIDHPFAV